MQCHSQQSTSHVGLEAAAGSSMGCKGAAQAPGAAQANFDRPYYVSAVASPSGLGSLQNAGTLPAGMRAGGASLPTRAP